MHARGISAPHQVVSDCVLVAGATVELKPEHVRRNLRSALYGHSAHEPECVGHPRALGGGGKVLIGAGPDDRGAAHGGDTDWSGVALSEQLDIDRGQCSRDPIAGNQLDCIEGAPIAGNAAIRTGASVQVFEREARQPPPRTPA